MLEEKWEEKRFVYVEVGLNLPGSVDAEMTIMGLGGRTFHPFYAAIRPRISCKPCSASSMRPSRR